MPRYRIVDILTGKVLAHSETSFDPEDLAEHIAASRFVAAERQEQRSWTHGDERCTAVVWERYLWRAVGY